ncbi:hypothetical protein [Vibrio vulnificus YJ016]|uniref:Uncharacterized protein n=1 Tax=Vibrio vulnificus (strain YJ016) TaxID=196600 RepID=Q7MG01_VIBVY|nr:hypothetical protein [Vibrio vulnificus YJ016]
MYSLIFLSRLRLEVKFEVVKINRIEIVRQEVSQEIEKRVEILI